MSRVRVSLLLEGVAEAASTLGRHPLRAALAGLAMAVAVATAVVVQTALNGLAASARETSARAFGSDSFLITRVAAGTLSRRELAERIERNAPITRRDASFLEDVAAGRVIYAAVTERRADVGASGRTYENASVTGTQAALPLIRDITLSRGRFLTDAEESAGSPVAVIGQDIADELFPGRDPLGQTVRIGLRAFRVVGLQERLGTAGGQSLDRNVYVPLRAFERVFGTPASLQVFAAAGRAEAVAAAEDHARISMRARRQLAPGAADTFDIVTPEAARGFVDRLTERVGAGPPVTFMALLAAIVVVANTTLVSVTQRAREIGVRRAVGATRRSVIVETLAEAVLVALLGGATGVAAASGVLAVAGAVLDVPLPFDWAVVGASLAAAGASGVAAGWYPASRAASTDIVNALRLE